MTRPVNSSVVALMINDLVVARGVTAAAPTTATPATISTPHANLPDWEAALVLALGEVDGHDGAVAMRFAARVRAIALDLPDDNDADEDAPGHVRNLGSNRDTGVRS